MNFSEPAPEQLRALLKAMGHDVVESGYIGRVQAIAVNGEWLEGGSNSIPHGGALGY